MFTAPELAYLASQRLGRLATLASTGTLQNNPVGFRVDPERAAIEVYGLNLGATRKFANVAATGEVAFVVDDIASLDPWRVRCVEVRGTAEALTDQDPPRPGLSREVIRIHPRRIISFGLGTEGDQGARRNTAASPPPGPGS